MEAALEVESAQQVKAFEVKDFVGSKKSAKRSVAGQGDRVEGATVMLEKVARPR